jgi:hypothetical protein
MLRPPNPNARQLFEYQNLYVEYNNTFGFWGTVMYPSQVAV